MSSKLRKRILTGIFPKISISLLKHRMSLLPGNKLKEGDEYARGEACLHHPHILVMSIIMFSKSFPRVQGILIII